VRLYASTPVAFLLPDVSLLIDESGTSEIPGNTSHFVLAGLSIPIERWKFCDAEIDKIRAAYGVPDQEIHVAWLRRPYIEQSKIPGFSSMTQTQRRSEVGSLRRAELLRLQRAGKNKQYRQIRKNYLETDRYCHLTIDERRRLATDLARCVSAWSFARLFAECIPLCQGSCRVS